MLRNGRMPPNGVLGQYVRRATGDFVYEIISEKMTLKWHSLEICCPCNRFR